jgi:hypothetical protein
VSILLQIRYPIASDILLVALNDENGISNQCIVIRANRQNKDQNVLQLELSLTDIGARGDRGT